jgi:protein-tyrosine-phosphatase
VATPLHAESAKRFDLLRSMDPDFYQRLIDVFPDMTVQERYWHDYDPDLALADYLGKGWAGIAAYIEEQVEDPWNKEQALARLAEYRGLAIRQPESYTPDHLLRAITNGAIFRTVMPVGTRTKERLRKKG